MRRKNTSAYAQAARVMWFRGKNYHLIARYQQKVDARDLVDKIHREGDLARKVLLGNLWVVYRRRRKVG